MSKPLYEPSDREILDQVAAGHTTLASLSQALWPRWRSGRPLGWQRPPQTASAIQWLASQVRRLSTQGRLEVVQDGDGELALVVSLRCLVCERSMARGRLLFCGARCAKRHREIVCLDGLLLGLGAELLRQGRPGPLGKDWEMTVPQSYVAIWEQACTVVAKMGDDGAVEAKLLAVQKALQGRGTLVRGLYESQPHWWMLLIPRTPEERAVGTAILDIACLGRVPQVQLVLMDRAPGAWQRYQQASP